MYTKVIQGTEDLSDALLVRKEVFTIEQGFADPDSDENEQKSTHVVIYDDNDQPVGTGRIFTQGDHMIVGRIAIIKAYRGKQLGVILMSELEKIARLTSAKKMILSAQMHACPFYEKSGFIGTNETHMDEHCLHQTMYKQL